MFYTVSWFLCNLGFRACGQWVVRTSCAGGPTLGACGAGGGSTLEFRVQVTLQYTRKKLRPLCEVSRIRVLGKFKVMLRSRDLFELWASVS